MRVSYGEMQEQMTQLVQAIVPDIKRYWSLEAETASVYPLRDHDYHDPIMHMLHSALEESREDDPNDSIVTRMRLNISPPEEYSGSSDLIKVYKTFVAGILRWLKLHGLLGAKYTETHPIELFTFHTYNLHLQSYLSFCKVYDFPIDPTPNTLSFFCSIYVSPH